MKRIIHSVLIALALALSGVSCSTDEETGPGEQQPPVPAGHVRMQITVPGLSSSGTYALAAVDECEVKEVDVLVFNNGKFLCHAPGENIADAPGASNGNTKTFIVDLSEAGDVTTVQVMVVANAQDIVATAAENMTPSVTTATEMMTMLEFTCIGKWNAAKASATDFTPFPMWGMAETDLSGIGQQPVSLMRAVAKIDVGLDFSGETARGLSTFKLESVHLYNSLDRGSVAPYDGHCSGTAAIAVSIPDPAVSDASNPLVYQGAADGFDEDGRSCKNSIYMAEHAAGSDGSSNNACLVIGGRYNGGTDPAYYRIDFVNASGSYLPVLRNHRYKVNVKSVDRDGYSSAQAAFGGPPLASVNIEVTDESLTVHSYNGQYALSVSTDALALGGSAAGVTGYIDLSTSYSGGYSATVTSGGDWLEITGGGGPTGAATASSTLDRISVSAKAANATASGRSGTVTVTSGTLTKTIIVTQPSSVSRFSVADALDEYPDDGSPQTLEVTADCDWYVKLSFGHAIVASFDTGGSGDGTFHFSLIDNDPVVVYGRPCATFVFYSPAGEFAPVFRTVKLPATTSDYYPAVHDGWAGSNIYWDGSKLTFDDVGDTTHQYYQGLHFKWGSLYGYGYNSVNNSGCTYVPDPASATGWSVDTGLDWNNIPYADGDFGRSYYGYDALYGIHEPSAGKGDICRYITEANGGALHGRKWRMPVDSEFAGWKNSSGSFDDVSGMVDSADGTWVNSANDNSGWTLEHNGKEVFFPASGGYVGMLATVGNYGIYWMSDAYYGDSYYLMSAIDSVLGNEVPNYYRAFSFSVRCVREQ